MKITDAIFKLMVGAALVIFSCAALSYASNTAKAEETGINKPSFYQPGEISSGKYRVQYTCGLDGTDKFYWFVTVSNTETGKFNVYLWSRADQVWAKEFGGMQVPELP